jgi:hypothetical protein
MLIGYARTSTLEQEAGLEAQRRELTALGVQRLFTEQTSSPARAGLFAVTRPCRGYAKASALPPMDRSRSTRPARGLFQSSAGQQSRTIEPVQPTL